MSFFAHADDQQVEPVGFFVVIGTPGGHFFFGNVALGQADILFLDIHQVEQFLVDPAVAALGRFRIDWIVLVDGIHRDIRKRKLAGIVSGHQFPIEGKRCFAGGQAQTEKTVFFLTYRLDDFVGDGAASIVGFRKDFCGYMFVGV